MQKNAKKFGHIKKKQYFCAEFVGVCTYTGVSQAYKIT